MLSLYSFVNPKLWIFLYQLFPKWNRHPLICTSGKTSATTLCIGDSKSIKISVGEHDIPMNMEWRIICRNAHVYVVFNLLGSKKSQEVNRHNFYGYVW
jgi:hypothetical protein